MHIRPSYFELHGTLCNDEHAPPGPTAIRTYATRQASTFLRSNPLMPPLAWPDSISAVGSISPRHEYFAIAHSVGAHDYVYVN